MYVLTISNANSVTQEVNIYTSRKVVSIQKGCL